MSTWSTRRKSIYGFIFIIALILIIGVPIFLKIYKAPTCFDNKLNGNETGIDCGGSCVRLCKNSYLSPNILWGGGKYEKLANGLYNVAALIENKNINGAAINVPYKFSLFDNTGMIITERNGYITLYAHRNSLAFESAVDVGKRTPSKVSFEFLNEPNWFKSVDDLEGLSIIDKKYTEDENNSSLEIILENKTLFVYENVIVGVVLKDIDGNVIGFARTLVDNVAPKNGREVASFTWPISRKGKVTSIEVIPIVSPMTPSS